MKRYFAIGLLCFSPLLTQAKISFFPYFISGRKASEDATVAPIIVPKDEKRFRKAFVEQQTQWIAKQLHADFAKRNADAPWLKEAQEVIQGAAFNLAKGNENMYLKYNGVPPKPLVDLAEKVRADGCDDPLFNFLLAYLQAATIEKVEKKHIALAEKRSSELFSGGDKPAIKLLAANWIWFHSRPKTRAANGDRQKKMEAEMEKLLPEALKQLKGPEDDLGFYQLTLEAPGFKGDSPLNSYFWNLPTPFENAINQPYVSSWLKDSLLGDRAVWAAWEARSSGYAYEVSSSQWRGFEEQLRIATQHLTAAWKARPELPYAAERMIVVTMGGEGSRHSDLRLWFDRSVAACFDYQQAYGSVMWAYRPRWGGSHQLMLNFGKAAADTQRYDTLLGRVYKWALDDICSEYDDLQPLVGKNELWAPGIEIFKKMLVHAKTVPDQDYLRSWIVQMAIVNRDYLTAAQYYQENGARISSAADRDLYNTFGIRNFEWRGFLAAQRNFLTSVTFEKAETAFASHQLAEAKSHYLKLTEDSFIAASPEAKDLVRQRLAAIAVEERMATKQWVKLSQDEHLLLWRNQDKNLYTPVEDGKLTFTHKGNRGTPSTYLTARIGMNFEVRAQIDNPENVTKTQFGIFFGYRPGFRNYVCAYTGTCPGNRSYPQGSGLIAYGSGDSPDSMPVATEIKRDSTIRLRCIKGKVTYWVDEKELYTLDLSECYKDENAGESSAAPAHYFGFGGDWYPKGEARIKNIEFRRL